MKSKKAYNNDITTVELHGFICDVLGIDMVNTMIKKQIVRFKTELGLSNKEIARALVYYSENEKGNLDPKYGIGIVPHVVSKANAYYEELKRKRDRQIESVKSSKKEPDIILKANKTIKQRKRQKIDLDKIDLD
ncbi:MAG: hypothetical protein ACOCUD_04120 [Bacillota bacterium]